MAKNKSEDLNLDEEKTTDEHNDKACDNENPQSDLGEEKVDVKDSMQEEEALKNKLLRLQADFLNYKNRTEKEKISTYTNAIADVLKDVLPILDNFERALESDKSENNSFKDGIKMVYTGFVEVLNKKGLKEIDALNKQFDANLHFAVSFEDSDSHEDNEIVEVFQKGYMVNDRVIRPTMVKVCKK